MQLVAGLLGDDDRWVEVPAGRVQEQGTLGAQQLPPRLPRRRNPATVAQASAPQRD